jgi:ubiquinone/menaquinone biosynthesis C-methylase UbiE
MGEQDPGVDWFSTDALMRQNIELLEKLESVRSQIDQSKGMVDASRLTPSNYHFVDEYRAHVQQLMAQYPLDEAMSLAVGGDYDGTGKALVAILQNCGLSEGMSIIDLGCGSGRLAKHLGITFDRLNYLGIDVVQELLDYARSKSPEGYQFKLNHELRFPAENEAADMIVAFSVFTHLLHEESYIYLDDARRVLRPGGSVVFSFLEAATNWPIFEAMIGNAKTKTRTHLNMIIERSQIQAWADHLGFEVLGYDFGPPHGGHGQTVTVLKLREVG